MSDARYVDTSLGVLTGEGAEQRVESEESVTRNVWQREPEQTAGTYYDLPALKKTVWKVEIPIYYFVGGTAGSMAMLGAAAALCNREGAFNRLTTYARLGALGGSMMSAVLLIHDLGRPERFIYMLRVFRPTSPMSVGTWMLSSFGACLSLSWLASKTPLLSAVEKPAYAVAGLLGLGMSGYTGVLIGNTAVPLWQQVRRELPVLFIASSAASAGSLLSLAPLDEAEDKITERFSTVAKTVELTAGSKLERRSRQVPAVARPLRSGTGGTLWKISRVCVLVSLAATLAGHKWKAAKKAGGILGAAGSLTTRLAIHEAGKESAQDARALFTQQREGLGAKEVTGSAAVTSSR